MTTSPGLSSGIAERVGVASPIDAEQGLDATVVHGYRAIEHVESETAPPDAGIGQQYAILVELSAGPRSQPIIQHSCRSKLAVCRYVLNAPVREDERAIGFELIDVPAPALELVRAISLELLTASWHDRDILQRNGDAAWPTTATRNPPCAHFGLGAIAPDEGLRRPALSRLRYRAGTPPSPRMEQYARAAGAGAG